MAENTGEGVKRSMDDPRYHVGGMFLLSRWLRENETYPQPAFKVGDKVTFTLQTEITSVGKDCDGSTLYGADMIGFGWGEESFTASKDDDT